MSKAPEITLDQFKSQAKARKVYIFAVNLEGIGFLKLFTRLGLDIGGFIDSRPIPGASKRGQPVIHPDKFFADLASDALVVITAKHRQTKRQAMERCEQAGLKRGETFFTTTDLCDYLPTIEIAGLCNLRCISCNMGIPGANLKGGYMSAADYRQVLTKMREGNPLPQFGLSVPLGRAAAQPGNRRHHPDHLGTGRRLRNLDPT
jgi:hypothetical protein